MKRIVLATKNEGKVKEFKSIFDFDGIEIVSLNNLKYEGDIEETGITFEENALIKAKEISLMLNEIVISDDSGLEVLALNNEPGIYSARYAGDIHDDKLNNALLVKNLENVSDTSARYVCAIAIYNPNGSFRVVREECNGKIIRTPKGTNGFGYDPYFYFEDKKKTFAELSLSEKNEVSHRAKAIRRMKEEVNEDFSFK